MKSISLFTLQEDDRTTSLEIPIVESQAGFVYDAVRKVIRFAATSLNAQVHEKAAAYQKKPPLFKEIKS